MRKRQAGKGKTMPLPGGLAVGGAVSLGITLAGTAILAWLINQEVLAMENSGYWILGMLLSGSFLGALVAYGRVRRQRLLVCGLSGCTYFALLMALTAMFFGGQYSGVGVTGLVILAGSMAAGFLGLGQGRGGRRHKIRVSGR